MHLIVRRISNLETSTLLLALAVIGPVIAISIMASSNQSPWAEESIAQTIGVDLLFFSSPVFAASAAALSVRDARRTNRSWFTLQAFVAGGLVAAFVLFIFALRGAA